MLTAIESVFNRLTVILAGAVAASIGLIAVLIPLNLILVKTGNTGIWWLFEGVEYTLFFGLFLGAPWVLQQNAHVRVDIVDALLPDGAARRLDQALNIAGFLLCAFLCFYGARTMIAEFNYGTLPDKELQIANWIVLAAYVASFLMLAIEFLFRLHPNRLLNKAKEGKVEDVTDKAAGF